jgi:hypothetical protein
VSFVPGDATVVWKQGERVIYADNVRIGKDLRIAVVDDTSLLISGVDTQYTGKILSFYMKTNCFSFS